MNSSALCLVLSRCCYCQPSKPCSLQQTLIDYAGEIVSIMFTSTWSLACLWCQNCPVIRGESPLIYVRDIFDTVENSKHNNFVISGGGPTI